jgi:CDP-diacylglycerol--glycerol-3-phosphate 3-phosphatidyltransferase
VEIGFEVVARPNFLVAFPIALLVKHLPNIITLSRVVVLALLVWLAFAHWTGAATLAFFCILYGAISDFVDGYLARKYNVISNFGKIMDALVDKVMVLGSLVLLILVDLLYPLWLVLPLVILISIRELGITWMRLVAARKGVVLAAETSGKRKAIWQITAVCVLFAVPMFSRDLQRVVSADVSLLGHWVWLNGMLYFLYASYLTISSGALYFGRYWHVFTAPRQNGASS